MKYITFVVLYYFFVFINSNSELYNGYKVYELYPQSIFQNTRLEIYAQNDIYDFWIKRSIPGQNWIVMVPPTVNFKQHMDEFYKIKNTEIISDVSMIIQKGSTPQKTLLSPGEITFNKYHNLYTINNYLKKLADRNPDTVTLFNIGKSWEMRNIFGVKISHGYEQNKPGILINSGLSGREWIGPATALYIIDQLIYNPYNSYMYLNVDWYIIPILNPDGYDYTQKSDRFWQKNRSNNRNLNCVGVDLTKNFDFHFAESGSGNKNPCKSQYIGPAAFSERETTALYYFMKKYGKNIKLYLSLHSFGPMLLYPWTYTTFPVKNERELHKLGQEVSSMIYQKTGTDYKVGSYVSELYAAGGVDTDWMMGAANVSLVYSLHMPNRGSVIFDPAEKEIEGVVKEVFQGINVFHKYVEKKWSNSNDHEFK